MSKKIRLLQNGRLTEEFEIQLAGEFDLSFLWQVPDPEAFLARHGGEFVGLVTSGGPGADAVLIDALPALKVIASRGVGYDKIDIDMAKTRGIAVSNTPGVLTDCVADLAVGALIAVIRRVCEADRFVRDGGWLQTRFPLTTRVNGKKLGIVGMGRIGKAVARRAQGFNMEIRYHSRTRIPESPFGFEPDLTDLAHWADFMVLCVPGGPETHHLVSSEIIGALGPSGTLVNVARGSIVDETALVAALLSGQLAAAALDVYEDEPNVPSELMELPNVVLLPHIASNTTETFEDMENLVLENLKSFFDTGHLLTPVS